MWFNSTYQSCCISCTHTTKLSKRQHFGQYILLNSLQGKDWGGEGVSLTEVTLNNIKWSKWSACVPGVAGSNEGGHYFGLSGVLALALRSGHSTWHYFSSSFFLSEALSFLPERRYLGTRKFAWVPK